jgi:BON domain-containing protein
MLRTLDFYRGLVVGLGIMYLMDPQRGRARRALLRDKAAGALHDVRDFLGRATRDLSHRAEGTVARAVSHVRPDHADDDTLAERVRSKLGRYVSHPHALEVEAKEGCVTLRGPILSREAGELIDAVSSVRGVRELVNRLEPHETGEDVPALQGGSVVSGERPPLAPWSPGMQLLAGVLGAALLSIGVQRVADRMRRESLDELESEMPEYAMLR